jgi:hypothetical protein
VNKIINAAVWALFGAMLAFGAVAVYQVVFTGGAMKATFSAASAQSAAGIGAIIGGLVGFFRKG